MIWVSKIMEAINYIEENLFEPINIESVGKAINYAPSSFSNLFSAFVGYSVGEYIRYRRLTVAAELLTKEKLSISDIAYECKYDTPESFSKAFKRFFNCTPSQFTELKSKVYKFSPITINFSLQGGFSMTRNIIPGLQKVSWKDTQRQSEYVNSIVSALNGLGENLSYDYVCAVSGSAFRTSFSNDGKWNHGNYHVIHTPIIIEHTFKMLGYNVSHYKRSDFKADSRIIIDSIDKGIPVITLEGVINCSDTCVISGYDNDGHVLLGYNPFMDVEDDHDEPHDDTGYFRKSNWHDETFIHDDNVIEKNDLRILIIGEKCEKPDNNTIFSETMKIVFRLIQEKSLYEGQYNGISAHKEFANALMNYEWGDNFEPYLNVMCNFKQYLDRQYAVKFFQDNKRNDLAEIYNEITMLTKKLAQIIPQDFSVMDMFGDKEKLKPYCDILLKICSLEEKVLSII
jgi:AraC-like DNA-binding protein